MSIPPNGDGCWISWKLPKVSYPVDGPAMSCIERGTVQHFADSFAAAANQFLDRFDQIAERMRQIIPTLGEDHIKEYSDKMYEKNEESFSALLREYETGKNHSS